MSEVGAQKWTAARRLIVQALALVTALAALEYVRTRYLFDFNAAALGEYTSSVFGKSAKGEQVHCTGTEVEACIRPWSAAGRPPVILWFGNSQLHGVNRYGPGDKTAVMRLHDSLSASRWYVIGYTLPNMTLPETALAWERITNEVAVETVLLPVVFNALRNAAIRDNVRPLLAGDEMRRRLLASPVGRHLTASLAGPATAPTEAGEKSLAVRVEDRLERGFAASSPLWRDRSAVRTLLDYIYYKAWHGLVGATAQSKRSLVGPGYEAQMVLLDDLVRYMRSAGVRVLLYVPPYRQDIAGPYIEGEYRSFKRELAAIAARQGAEFADLDSLVDGEEWGMVRDQLLGTEDYDFMHFTARGHHRLAHALLARLTAGDR